MNRFGIYGLMTWLAVMCACTSTTTSEEQFALLDNKAIGLNFSNDLTYSNDFNVYKYRNYYNGGGVAIGDINNDGFVDIYLTANQKPNQLFLNNGDITFENISETSGTEGTRAWSTGVTMVDINADGYLDIYVCNSGDVSGDNKENELFINNGDLTFTESAAAYGLNDKGYSTHSSFFDYDKDGDLDVYILNNSYQAIGGFNLKKNERPIRDEFGGDKLMQNQNGVFVDVSEQAGIYGSVIGFGLGITVGDVNNDGWEDIYVSNDFFERDYLYLNQQDGTFSENLTKEMKSISGASMGADMADINNDGHMDIFVTEMLPSDNQRLKTVTTFEDWNKYQYNVANGYHHQFTRNMLQVNNGNATFSELGRFSGVEASDWSWGALFFDMDNDGLRDLFVANGIYQDLTNQDYLQYVANEEVIKSIVQDSVVNYKKLIDIIPSNKVPNHFYRNNGELSFSRMTGANVDKPSFSNGAAYGDLDNDGDLDLVVNNVNMPAFIYRNNADLSVDDNYIKISLKGEAANPNAIGAKIEVTTNTGIQSHEVQPARGFQSSMDVRANFGVNDAEEVLVRVTWPDGSIREYPNLKTNQSVVLDKAEGSNVQVAMHQDEKNLFEKVPNFVNFQHKENPYNDFNRERLIYHMRSTEGPKLAIGEVIEKGKLDVLITGAKGVKTELLHEMDGAFETKASVDFKTTAEFENTENLIFDANGDGLMDVYMASGGTELSPFSDYLYDQLYINQGNGQFSISNQKLPSIDARISTGAVVSADIDDDGDQDLFVGERSKIGAYGQLCSGFLLVNDGAGQYTDQTSELAPQLQNIGMVTDASFADIDGDGDQDLIVVGDFMTIEIFENTNGDFSRVDYGLDKGLYGWWNTVRISDIDHDGDLDIVAGNHGLNSRFRASESAPIKMYFSDFDQNGFAEGIMTYQDTDGKDYPYALRHNLIDQLKYLKRQFPDFDSYKDADMTKIFSAEQLEDATVIKANNLETVLLINDGEFHFRRAQLPTPAQYSPVYAIATHDFDGDGDEDIVMGGNLYNVLPEAGIYDASFGTYLENKGGDDFTSSPDGNGFLVNGEIRDLQVIGDKLLVSINSDSLQTFRFKSK